MRRIAFAAAISAGLLSAAGAQAPQPVQPTVERPVDIHLSVNDQNDLLATCALAMRSPQITDVHSVIMLGEFCARLRINILDATRRAQSASQPPKD